jgi:hypothetical protein
MKHNKVRVIQTTVRDDGNDIRRDRWCVLFSSYTTKKAVALSANKVDTYLDAGHGGVPIDGAAGNGRGQSPAGVSAGHGEGHLVSVGVVVRMNVETDRDARVPYLKARTLAPSNRVALQNVYNK